MIVNKSLKNGFLAAGLLTAGLNQQVSGQSPVAPPAAYNASTAKVSFIRTWDAAYPTIYENALLTAPLKDAKQATQYFDGLGRPLQTVIKQGSLETGGTATDLVSPVVYDEFGREIYKYLPFAANNTGGNASISDGLFKLNPFQQQATFMTAQYGGQGETFFYSKTNYESSPINRAEKTMAAGNSWAGAERGVQIKNWLNTASDDVKIWGVSNSGTPGVFGTYTVQSSINNGVYAAGELYKNVMVDEHGKQVIEFKDKADRVVLKKVQLTASADNGLGDGYAGWMCTYYIYDDRNNLRCVVQPEGVKALATGSWQVTTTLLNEQSFRYEYDGRGRMIMKKVPGAGELYMVYDVRDRLVMTQDANMRVQTKWLVTKYDALNRPEETGLWENAGSFATHLSNAKGSTSYPVTSSNYEELSKTFYEDYSWLSSYGNPLPSSYSNSYDTYFQSASNLAWPYPQSNVQSSQLKGMATGSRVKVLGTSTYLYTVSFYDAKARVIQAQSTNITGGIDIATTQYSWAGQPLIVVNKQEKAGTGAQTTVVVAQLTYDDLGRLVKTEKKLSNTNVNGGNMSDTYKTIAELEYDKLGQLKKKKLAPAYNSSAGLETLNYEYNIRGWMLGMNRDYARDASSANYFGFDLGYDKTSNDLINNQTYTAAQYNGNITGMVWKSRGDGEKRKYDFSYDAANRLLKADFTQYSSGAFNQSAGVNFNMKMGDGSDVNSAYDYNGNIKRMQQWGLKITGSTQIDDLKYTYETNSNKLKSVTDFANDAQTKLGDFRTAATHPQAAAKSALTISSPQSAFEAITDFSYDVNGNLNLDNNKAISSITYNHLNLPQTITVTGKGTITYTYDAAGAKLKKEADEPASPSNGNTHTITTTSYIGGAVYESKTVNSVNSYSDKLQFIGMEEGRIRYAEASPNTCTPMPSRFIFDYMLKDHLGNVRSVLTEQLEPVCYIPATVEDASWQTENAVYDIVDGRRILKATTGATQSSFGDKLYRVHGGLTNEKSGLGVALKVMSGDQVKIMAESYYTMPGGGPGQGTGTIALSELLTAFVGSGAVSSSHGGLSTGDVSGAGANSTAIPGFISSQNEGSNNARAFVMWLLLDEQFRFVAGNADPVQAGGDYKLHTAFFNSPVQVTKNGYLYIYVSNESNLPVYFDNLSISHTPGPSIEETHYYPFGLEEAGISYRALEFGNPQNKKKYNGIEKENDFGIEIYDAQLRELDGQVGRWWQIDPKIEKMEMWSPYASNYNNPIRYSDPIGDEPGCCRGFFKSVWNGFVEKAKGTWNAVTHPGETIQNSFSAEGIKQNLLNTVSFGTYSDIKAVQENGFGGYLGGKLFDGAAYFTTNGLVKSMNFKSGQTKGSSLSTASESESMTLYRGVNESHANFDDALQGTAIPKGGTATPLEHNLGNTNSPFTSWTTDPNVATNYALRPNGNGVILEIEVPKVNTVKSPSKKSVNLIQSPGTIVNEAEVLIKGGVFRSKVTQVINNASNSLNNL